MDVEEEEQEDDDAYFAQACAVEMHMDISQEPFRLTKYRKNAARAGFHLDQTPGLNCDRKNPSVWPHCLGSDRRPCFVS